MKIQVILGLLLTLICCCATYPWDEDENENDFQFQQKLDRYAKLASNPANLAEREESDPVVAFSAVGTSKLNVAGTDLEEFDTVPYTHVYTNIGNGYDPERSTFTVPVKGVYDIFFSITRKPDTLTRAILVKNGDYKNDLGSVYMKKDGAATTSNRAVVALNAGDVLEVMCKKSMSILSGTTMSFSGFLIRKD